MDIKRKITYFATIVFSCLLIGTFSLNLHSEDQLSKQESKVKLQTLVTLNFEQIPLKAAFEAIADYSGFETVEVDNSIATSLIDIQVEKISTEALFKLMSQHYNLHVYWDEKVLNVNAGSDGISTSEPLVHLKDIDELGTKLSFSITKQSRVEVPPNGINTKEVKFDVWSEFNKESYIKLPNNWQMVLKVTDQGDTAFLDMKLLDASEPNVMETIAEPKLMTAFGKEAMIEVGDDSQMISVKVIAKKSTLADAKKES